MDGIHAFPELGDFSAGQQCDGSCPPDDRLESHAEDEADTEFGPADRVDCVFGNAWCRRGRDDSCPADVMSGPAVPCEWCGGPIVWTIIRGEHYVSCTAGCLSLPGLGLDPLPDSSELIRPEQMPNGTIREGGGSRTQEGGAASDDTLPF